MAFKFGDVPYEVLTVWAVQWSGQPVGKEMYDRCMSIKKKYPEWFPEYDGQELPIKDKNK